MGDKKPSEATIVTTLSVGPSTDIKQEAFSVEQPNPFTSLKCRYSSQKPEKGTKRRVRKALYKRMKASYPSESSTSSDSSDDEEYVPTSPLKTRSKGQFTPTATSTPVVTSSATQATEPFLKEAEDRPQSADPSVISPLSTCGFSGLCRPDDKEPSTQRSKAKHHTEGSPRTRQIWRKEDTETLWDFFSSMYSSYPGKARIHYRLTKEPRLKEIADREGWGRCYDKIKNMWRMNKTGK